MTSLQRAVGALLATVLSFATLSACSSSTPDPRPSEPSGPRYVALGDSMTAGAGIGSTSAPCYRSRANFPSLIADELGVKNFVDASCIGATTADVREGHVADDGEFVPAQMDDLTADTDVVSITIGGNDSEFLASLYVACYVPPGSSAKACSSAVERLPAQLDKIQQNIAATLAAIRKKAPRALVVLVGYPRIMPDSGSCDPSVVPIAEPHLGAAAKLEGQLEATMRAAAKQGGAEYVDMRKRSVGHDACAGKDDAWVSGNSPEPGDGTFLHPRAKGAKAMARAVLPVVKARLGE